VCRLKQALTDSKIEGKQDYISQPQALDVCGTVLQLDPDSTVVYGTAICSVRDKKMDTGIPVVHASMILDGVRVAVTSVLCNNVTHTRSASHFVCSGDNKCVNVRTFQLGRRCESSVIWQPMLSHFLRRVHTNAVHTKSFLNLGLQLQDTKYTSMPLCDVVESSSGPYSCFSVFV
jgi:hypothetical protein